MNLDDIYTPLEEAKKELERRWNDPELKRKVEEFLGDEFPDIFKSEPRAILARAILTPNYETKYFLDVIDLIKIKPVCGEFSNDKFCTMNKDKLHLGKLVFLNKSKKGTRVLTKKTIFDFEIAENKKFNEIKTMGHGSLIDFHHNLYKRQYGELIDMFDISIFKRNNETALEVYKKIFSLCTVFGILFENFISKDTEHEKEFTERVVIPAYMIIKEKFSIKPLIVPLLPLKNEEFEAWTWYPGHLENEQLN